MFEPNEENNERIDSLLTLFRKHARGTLVPHESIEKTIGVKRKWNRDLYTKITRRARDLLRDEDGVWSRPEKPLGFLLMTEQQTLDDEPALRRRKAVSQYRLLTRAVVKLPTDTLTPLQRRLREVRIEDAEQKKRMLMDREALHARQQKPFGSKPYRATDEGREDAREAV